MRLARSRYGVRFGIVLCSGSAPLMLLMLSAFPLLGGAFGDSWREGLAHPFSRLDHFVAVVAMGLWATQLDRPMLWAVPAFFMVSIAGGAGLSWAGVLLPGAEDCTALSVAVLGVLLAVAARPQPAIGAVIVGLSGAAHGYAHGAEMAEAASPFLYGLGLLTATALLQLAGIALGLAARNPVGQKMLPIGAAAVAGIGTTLMLAL